MLSKYRCQFLKNIFYNIFNNLQNNQPVSLKESLSSKIDKPAGNNLESIII